MHVRPLGIAWHGAGCSRSAWPLHTPLACSRCFSRSHVVIQRHEYCLLYLNDHWSPLIELLYLRCTCFAIIYSSFHFKAFFHYHKFVGMHLCHNIYHMPWIFILANHAVVIMCILKYLPPISIMQFFEGCKTKWQVRRNKLVSR